MSLKNDLIGEVRRLFRTQWSERDGRVVPSEEDIGLGNDAVKLADAVVLYADMADSTNLVDTKSWKFAAEVYKAFLHCAAKIIRSEGGEITAYDGDRIMAVFIGEAPNTRATRSALKINYCREHIINPMLAAQYPNAIYQVSHVIGIDRSDLHVARTGIRGSNDLVWVGTAANHAAKLATLSDYRIWISGEVHDRLNDSVSVSNGKSMWEECKWNAMGGRQIYRSNWTYRVD